MNPVEEFTISARSARAFDVDNGQRFRIVAHEGTQVSDVALISRDDHSETFGSDMSMFLNSVDGTGTLWQLETLYSRPPGEQVMARVTKDTICHHLPWAGGMCSSLLYEKRGLGSDHPNCADLLHEAFEEYGLQLAQVPEVFNVGLNVGIDDDSTYYKEPEFGKDDFIEFEATMDLVVGVSACPNETAIINRRNPKSLRIVIRE